MLRSRPTPARRSRILGGVVSGGEGGFDVEDAVQAAAAAAGVAVGGSRVQDGAHVPVLDREGDQAARTAGDVPGELVDMVEN
jgi:hypothetical protein